LNANISTERGTPAINTAAASVEKVRKPRKGSAEQDATSCKFYIGEIKDGLPVLNKEVSEAEALVDYLVTQRPFMTVQLWKTDKQAEGARVILMKVPAVGK
jgi:hypothetical protein